MDARSSLDLTPWGCRIGYNRRSGGTVIVKARLDSLVHSWPEAGAGDPEDGLLDAIAREATALALRCTRGFRLSADLQKDIAQHVSDRFVRLVRETRKPPDRPEALVWRMTENRVRDHFRKVQRDRDALDRFAQEPASQTPDPDPELLWLQRERQERAERLVREVLATAPENYRQAIERHWLNGEPIESLVDDHFRELSANRVLDADEHVVLRRKARNRVDQHLKRGRDWLRKRLSERLREEEP